MIQTLRRLDEGERYLGLTLPMWAGAVVGAVVLYLGVRFSPLPVKPTITITLFACAFTGMIIYGVSGQALSPTRQLWAIATYVTAPKLLALADKPERRGLVLTAVPPREPGDTADDLNAAPGNLDQLVGVEHRLDAPSDIDKLQDQVDDEDRWDPNGDLAPDGLSVPEPSDRRPSTEQSASAVRLDSGDRSAEHHNLDGDRSAVGRPQPPTRPSDLADPTAWEGL